MQIQTLSKFLVAVIAVSQLSACGVIAVGGVAATATVMADRRTPGVQAIDKGIELQASGAFDKKFADSAHINVTSFNQKVLLTGEVKDAAIKSEAESYIKGLKNVRSVFNELIIGPNSTYTMRANDTYLESKIKTQMIFTQQRPRYVLRIKVRPVNPELLLNAEFNARLYEIVQKRISPCLNPVISYDTESMQYQTTVSFFKEKNMNSSFHKNKAENVRFIGILFI